MLHFFNQTFFLILIIASFEFSFTTETDDTVERPKIISVEVGAVGVESREPQLYPVELQNGGDERLINNIRPEAGRDKNTPVKSTRPKPNGADLQNGESSASIPYSNNIHTSGMEENPSTDHLENKQHEKPAMDDLMRINRFMNASLAHFLNLPNVFGREEIPSSDRIKKKQHEYQAIDDMMRGHRFINASLAHFLSNRIHRLTRLGESMGNFVSQAFSKVLPIRAHAKTGEHSGYLLRKQQHGGSPHGKHWAHDHEQHHSVSGPSGRDHYALGPNGRDHHAEGPNGRDHYAAGPSGRGQPDTSPDAQSNERGYYFDSGRNHHAGRPRPNMGKHAHKHKLALDVEDFRKAIFLGFALGVLCVLILSMVVFIVNRILPKRFTSAIRRLPYGKEKPLSLSSSDYSPITLLFSPLPRATSASRRPTLIPCDDKT